jgi:hypothetical protein
MVNSKQIFVNKKLELLERRLIMHDKDSIIVLMILLLVVPGILWLDAILGRPQVMPLVAKLAITVIWVVSLLLLWSESILDRFRRCPECKSKNIDYLVTPVGYVAEIREAKCRDCRHEWII